MTVASLLNRPEAYRVSTFRSALAPKDEYNQQILVWSLLDSDVPFRLDLLPGTGKLAEMAVGVMAEGHYPAFGLHGVGLKQGDGIEITYALDANEIGRRFVVERGKDFGPTGGWQGEVSETEDNFEPAAS